MPSYLFSIHFNIIPHLRLDLQSSFKLQVFPQNPVWISLLRSTFPSCLILLDTTTQIIFDQEYTYKLLSHFEIRKKQDRPCMYKRNI